MKILLFSEIMWPFGSGGELATYLWVRVLAPSASITVATAAIGESVEKELRGLGVEVKILRGLDVSSRARLWGSLNRCRDVVNALVKDHDVVWIPRLGYPVIPLARQTGKAVVVHLHDYVSVDPSGAVVSPRYGRSLSSLLGLRAYVKRLLSVYSWRRVTAYITLSNKVIFVSRRQRDIVCSRRPALCGSHTIIPNPLPPCSSIPSEPSSEIISKVIKAVKGRDYVLFGGGLSELKGYSIVRELAKTLRRWGMVTLISKAGKLEVDESPGIIYLPRLSYEEYLWLLSNAKAFLYPSLYEEPLPYAVIEAVLRSVPPVVTDVGGMPEILGRDYPLYVRGMGREVLDDIAEKLLKDYGEILDYVRRRANLLRREWCDGRVREMFLNAIKEFL